MRLDAFYFKKRFLGMEFFYSKPIKSYFLLNIIFFYLKFTPCKDEQPIRDIELQEKEAEKGLNIQEIYLQRTSK